MAKKTFLELSEVFISEATSLRKEVHSQGKKKLFGNSTPRYKKTITSLQKSLGPLRNTLRAGITLVVSDFPSRKKTLGNLEKKYLDSIEKYLDALVEFVPLVEQEAEEHTVGKTTKRFEKVLTAVIELANDLEAVLVKMVRELTREAKEAQKVVKAARKAKEFFVKAD